VFNCVEGNTTFYATPSQAQCQQWRQQVPDDFRFLFKFPRPISHDRLLAGVDAPVRDFLERLAPLRDVLGPFLVQLPAAFGPEHLDNLWRFADALPPPLTLAVEVRHPAFFQKGEAERALNRGLDAQRKKPRLPVHLLPSEAAPVIRYIGHPQLDANRPFLAPWLDRVAAWLDAGARPFLFLHMPDNNEAVALARLWTEMLMTRIPGLAPLPLREAEQPQLGLF
jgi:uncharacterized protein YecE (DUF72 family)